MTAFRLYEPDELGADGYPPEWHQTIKHQVRADAGERCLRCHHPYERGAGEWSRCDDLCRHGGPVRYWSAIVGSGTYYGPDETIADAVSAQWRILTVHHLDGDKANCRWFNLVALCQRCHLEVQGRVVMDRPWPWEHSTWMKPYVAGFYAVKYGGEDLERSEVESRLDELLALGRQAEAVERMPL